MYHFLLTASDSRAEMLAAIWKIPSEFDNSVNDDTSASAQSLEHLCNLDSADFGDVKW